MKQRHKILRSGINRPIICKNCGKKVGYVRLRSRFKWKLFWQAAGIALVLEFVANLLVYLIFNGYN